MSAILALSSFTSRPSLRRNSLPHSTKKREPEFEKRMLSIMAQHLTQTELEAIVMHFGIGCVRRAHKEINAALGKPINSSFAQSQIDRARSKLMDNHQFAGVRKDFRLPQGVEALQTLEA